VTETSPVGAADDGTGAYGQSPATSDWIPPTERSG